MLADHRNRPGSATEILELISRFNFNIFIYKRQSPAPTECKMFKLGLFVTDKDKFSEFVSLFARKLCPLGC